MHTRTRQQAQNIDTDIAYGATDHTAGLYAQSRKQGAHTDANILQHREAIMSRSQSQILKYNG